MAGKLAEAIDRTPQFFPGAPQQGAASVFSQDGCRFLGLVIQESEMGAMRLSL